MRARPCAFGVVLTAQAATDSLGVARAVIGATREWSIPICGALVGGPRVTPGARALEDAGIPCYAFPEPAVKMLAGMAVLGERRTGRSEPVPAPPAPAEAQAFRSRLAATGSRVLGLLELQPLLDAYGIRCAAGRPAATPADAAAIAERIGFPVALKVLSRDISHKTQVGGVRLGLRSAAEVAAEAAAMLERVRVVRPQAAIEGVLVQPMVEAGKELLLGVVRDPQFGPLVMVGLGGIYVEVLKDTATRLAPVTAAEAAAMLRRTRQSQDERCSTDWRERGIVMGIRRNYGKNKKMGRDEKLAKAQHDELVRKVPKPARRRRGRAR